MNTTMSAAVIAKSIEIVNPQGAKLTISIDKDTFYTENSEMTEKDKQYVLNLSKFIREYSVEYMSSKLPWAKRFETFAKVINSQKSKNFRNLSSAIRRAFDTDTVVPRAKFQKQFFYEGGMKAIEIPEVIA